MEKSLEFNSQICTTREQSEKLLALGLKKETADMVYHYKDSRLEALRWELRPHPPVLRSNCRFNIEKLNVLKQKNSDGVVMSGEEYFDVLWGKDIPAWSLHRLLCLYGLDYTIKEVYNNAEECYGMLICAIEIAIEDEYFNKDYIEEKK